jgi:uncharacterized protein (TIGR02145 family)
LQAQNYFIDFSASGTATILDSIIVENLTQGTSLTLQGSDTLHLVGTVGFFNSNQNTSELRIYPNPFHETSQLVLSSESTAIVDIDVYDIVGRHMLHVRQEVQRGDNIFEVSGFSTGHYQIIISSQTWRKSMAFVSLNSNSKNPQIQINSTLEKEFDNMTTGKSTKSIVQMTYDIGDQMRFIGISGFLSEIVLDVPTSNKTIDFVYSSSSCGATYTDARDGTQYSSVLIGVQCWMAQNLAYLPDVVGPGTGSNTTPYYYVYGYNGTNVTTAKATSNYATYGVLYNWSAVMAGSASSSSNPSGVQGVCPTGWHLPSDAEWTELTDYLGGTNVAGGKLKETDTTHWSSPNASATNEYGYTALPGGIRDNDGLFKFFGVNGYWWSATENNTLSSKYRGLGYNISTVLGGNYYKENGFSVRCVRD